MTPTTSPQPVHLTSREVEPLAGTADGDSASTSHAASCEPGTSAAVDCCALGAGPIDPEGAEHLALRLKALSDPTRLQLLSHVAVRGCGDVCACDLTEPLGISQPTVSHHMKKLVDAGLLTRQQKGRWARYSVVPAAFAELRAFLDLS
ncbi:MAG: metalloregulator ArsR/SmtB family transcription factor [Brachybacterium sp.]|uniref:ArsR/SmtB family transcription factor n=1 Tax=Brachybacterium sp. TaxID=1891286 RepID=UPI002648C17D|nr:metalloregulator ArsR/SmtB family transcription factor [Brachybacterium sp.]MDN5686641.1 metalloregulator ArsR/SmtB family transcription factor [Brachybacterium sp.]